MFSLFGQSHSSTCDPVSQIDVNALCSLPHKLIPTSLFFFYHFDLHLIFISPTFLLPLPALSGARGYDGSHRGLLSRQPCQRDGGDARISAHTPRIHTFLFFGGLSDTEVPPPFFFFFFFLFSQLLSPEDLVNACKMFESLKLPLR